MLCCASAYRLLVADVCHELLQLRDSVAAGGRVHHHLRSTGKHCFEALASKVM
jgi:hypothetical protein